MILMIQARPHYLLINSPLRAIAALCFAVFFALSKLWTIFLYHPLIKDRLLFLYDSFLPNWAVTLYSLCQLVLWTSTLIVICRRSCGAERMYGSLLIASILISVMKGVLDSPALLSAVPWTQFAGDIVMVLCAVRIYRVLGRSN